MSATKSRVKIILVGIVFFFSAIALGIIALLERKNIKEKPEAGSDEQLAQARKAKAEKAKLEKEILELETDTNGTEIEELETEGE